MWGTTSFCNELTDDFGKSYSHGVWDFCNDIDPKQTFASCSQMARAHLLPPSGVSVEAYYGVSPYMAFSRPCA